MPVQNAEIAAIFNDYADLLEIDGANQYRVRAYRTAARNINSSSQSAAYMVKQNKDLSEIPGVGEDLAGKITEIVTTGKLSHLEEIKQRISPELLEIMKLSNLGPKRTKILNQKLGITSIKQLEKAAREQKIREVSGFGAKTEEKILAELEQEEKTLGEKKRLKISDVEELSGPLLAYLEKVTGVEKVSAAGSYRRGMETIGDLDILVTHQKDSSIMERFVEYEDVRQVVSKGTTRSTVILHRGFHVDLRAVPEASYGAALHYFTGSKAHNVAIRQMGVKRGLKINEYGVFRGEKRIAGKTEEEVYQQVDLPYIEPELRENRGEIEAAHSGQLPKLITQQDIRGDFHTHTNATEGRASLEDMARAAQEKGYEYLAITDHSKRLSMTHGLDANRLDEQIKKIDGLNKNLKDFVVLKGIEVDILEDGSLDLDNSILKKLDIVVCSVHYKFQLPRAKQTERIIKAITNSPVCTILAHPTGRLIGEREPYDVDMERLMKAAKDRGCILELNAQPERLDLTDVYCKMAKENGVMIAISSDAHSIEELNVMRFGIHQARRGWLETEDVLNTRKWAELEKILQQRR